MTPTASTATNLFPEIISEIFSYDRDKLNLKHYSLVCPEWRILAQDILFAKLTIRNLYAPSLNALPYSVIGKDVRYAHIRRFIRHLNIRISTTYSIDPDFHLFLRHLTNVRHLELWNKDAYFFGDNENPKIQGGITHIISSPSLEALTLVIDNFPLWLITTCKYVKRLTVGFTTWGFPIFGSPDFFGGVNNNAPVIQSLRLLGDTPQIDRFTQTIFHEPKCNMSLRGLEAADLCFNLTAPQGRGTIFSLLEYVRKLQLTFQFYNGVFPPSTLPLDASDLRALQNVRSLEFTISCKPFTAQDAGHVRKFLSAWLLPFLRHFPTSSMVSQFSLILSWPLSSTFEVLVNIPVDVIPSFYPVWENLDSALSDRTVFPQLENCTLSVPWIFTEDEVAKVFPRSSQKWMLLS